MSNRFCSRSKAAYVLLTLVLLVCCVCGCAAAQPAPVALPPIDPQFPPLQYEFRVSLYFARQDGSLQSEIQLLGLDEGQRAPFACIQRLIEGPTSGDLLPLCPPQTALNHVWLVEKVAYVDVALLTAQDRDAFSRACLQTLSEAFGVEHLVLTINGTLPDSAKVGVLTTAQPADPQTIAVLLYFPDGRGQFIVPSVRYLTAKPQQRTEALFALVMSATTRAELRPLVSSGEDEPVTLQRATVRGEELTLAFKTPQGRRMNLHGYAALARTILSNLPGIHRIVLVENDSQVRDVPGQQPDGRFTVYSTRELIGGMVPLYFASGSGNGLVEVHRVLPLDRAADPLTPLVEMMRGTLENERSGLMNVFPTEVLPGDIRVLRQHGNLMVLDLSSAFYQACKRQSEEGERLLAYAIVNALTQRQDIRAVLFLEEGANVETLSSLIILNKPLLRNPGLIMP